MVRFFIDRPVFAWVLAIVVMMAGALAVTTLPVAHYPSIAPPAISIQVTYPGASAETVQSTVTQVIEQQLSGIDHLLYFGSESDKDGSMTITLYFEQGTNPDIAGSIKWPVESNACVTGLIFRGLFHSVLGMYSHWRALDCTKRSTSLRAKCTRV
jgi:multidrug efflux pump subunit AcrB